MSAELAFAPISELAAGIAARQISPVELVRLYLGRIDALDGKLRSFITVCREEALAEAARAEAALQSPPSGRPLGPLHGVPLAFKDSFATAGVRTTGGSRVLGDWVPEQDATVVARLRDAGAIVLGKLNMHEFAYGPEGLNPHYGNVWNPWDAGAHRIAGGSSSGSAVAVAGGLCAGALGSDTGGSIRLPSALCNLTGLKPTYGRLSRAGVLPLGWSLDTVGPMTRTARDAALLLQVMAGADPRDSTSASVAVPDYLGALTGDVRGLRVGLVSRFFLERATPAVRLAIEAAARHLADLGAQVQDVSLPDVEMTAAAYLAVVWPEALSYHQRWLAERPGDYDPNVRDRLRMGLFVSAVDHVNGQRFREHLRARTDALLARCDVLLTPAVPMVANPVDEAEVVINGERRDRRGALILFSQVFNMTGHPALALPGGFDGDGMPIGLQLVGRAFDEATLLRVADAYQRTTDWHTHRAPLSSI